MSEFIDEGGGRLTQNNIGFGSLLLDQVRIIVATQHDTNVRVSLLDDICLFLSADECRVFVVGVLLVQGVESVSSNVSGDTGASDSFSQRFLLLLLPFELT